MFLKLFRRIICGCIVMCALLQASAQTGIRPYSLAFSQNLKGGVTLFGNTSMHIVDNDTVALVKMNETGVFSNGSFGNSVYGNDNQNMQFANIDPPAITWNLFGFGAVGWKYFQPTDGSAGSGWQTDTESSNWIDGTASFGYGGTAVTTIPSGAVTTYFQKTISIADPGMLTQLNFIVHFTDGICVYLNGTEIFRRNLSPAASWNTLADASGLSLGNTFVLPASLLTAGENVIAVEIHKRQLSGTFGFFDMQSNAVNFAPINSSSATLNLPVGNNRIKFARLYWGGRINNSLLVGAPDTLQKIKLRKGSSGAYSAATGVAANTDVFAVTADETIYQSYVDVTDYVEAKGGGVYSVADIPSSAGAVSSGGKFAGWCIVAVFENAALPYNSVRVYDGYIQVFSGGSGTAQSVTLTGLNVPENDLLATDASLAAMVWEGDANLGATVSNPAGDFIKINGITAADAVNPAVNFWNGSISRNGDFGTGRNPSYFNQMGIDIDEFAVGSGFNIQPGDTSVKIEFGTEADQFFPGLFAFSIRMKPPAVTITKTVTDQNANYILESGEELTYILSGTNSGSGRAFRTVITDSLPLNVTYVPNSLQVLSAPGILSTHVNQTDADDAGDFAFKGINNGRHFVKFFIGVNAANNTGGTLAPGDSYKLSFRVKASLIPGSVINRAQATSYSQAGDLFTDESTAIISPGGAPVPVTLTAFDAKLKNGNVSVNWKTENEVDIARYEVERSTNGTGFFSVASLDSRSSSAFSNEYTTIDVLRDVSAEIVYYRLRIVETDGSNSFSKTIALQLKTQRPEISIFPNPFSDHLTLSLKAAITSELNIRIVSFTGELLYGESFKISAGKNVIHANGLNKLPAGAMLLEATIGENKSICKIIHAP